MATRIKRKAAPYVSQTLADAQNDIKRLGDLQRQFERERGHMNDAIAEITRTSAPLLQLLSDQIETLQAGVQGWCEANRDSITSGGKTKTANLITGEVNWRQRPPSVAVRNPEGVIETLRRLGLHQMLRERVEVNKEAVLADPDKARGIAGLTIVTGVEDFVITPFAVEIEPV